MRIAILKCDTFEKNLKKIFIDYDEVIYTFLSNSIYIEEAITYDVTIPLLPQINELSNLDCLIISGSRNNCLEKLEWINQLKAYIRHCYNKDIKMIGFGFGHQIICDALGSKIESDGNWHTGTNKYNVNNNTIVKEIIGENVNTITLPYLHEYKVSCIDNSKQIAIIEDDNEGILATISNNKKILTFAGHPEYNGKILWYLFRVYRDFMSETELGKGQITRNNENDSNFISIIIGNLLRS